MFSFLLKNNLVLWLIWFDVGVNFIRVNLDIVGCVWKGEFGLDMLCVDREIFKLKKLCILNYLDIFGLGFLVLNLWYIKFLRK